MDPAPLDIKTEGNTIEKIERNRHALKYNLLRQKLFLEALIQERIFLKGNSPDKNGYCAVFEETPITALSMGRIIYENMLEDKYKQAIELGRKSKLPDSMEVPHEYYGYIPSYWYIISKDYGHKNPFGIRLGEQGELFMSNHELRLLQHEFENDKATGKIQKFKFSPHSTEKTLVIVQGCSMEHAFSLAESNYDIVFGDVYSELDFEAQANYNNLYNYLKDVCKSDSNGFYESKVVRKCLLEKTIVRDIIYCQKKLTKQRR